MLKHQKREFSLLRLLGAGVVVIGSLTMVLTTFSVLGDIKDTPYITEQGLLDSEIPSMGSGTEAIGEDAHSITAYQYAEITPAAGETQNVFLDDMLQNISVEYQNGRLIEQD